MKERPILFSAPMVRALLDGSKTQTRRIVKGLASEWLSEGFVPEFVADPANNMCPYGNVGDQLWVRETWQGPLFDSEEHEEQFRADGPEAFMKPGFCAYRATDKLDAIDANGKDLGWRPSIHMPRWASRIQLDITNVRIERLQDISEQDAWAEGCMGTDDDVTGGKSGYGEYMELWKSINGEGSWDKNPWVWVISFKLL